jgi:hypothetical protein
MIISSVLLSFPPSLGQYVVVNKIYPQLTDAQLIDFPSGTVTG